MKALHLVLIALLSSFALYACADPGEFAEFEADGVDELPDCMAEEFPFEPSLLSARTRNDRVGIFLQTTPDVKSRYDVVYFELFEIDDISTDEAIELAGPSVPPPPARGKMTFFSSCAYEHDSLELRGTLRFDTLETEAGGVIAGHLEDGYAIDARTGTIKIANLTGSWRFVVRQGPPYDDFYAIPERP